MKTNPMVASVRALRRAFAPVTAASVRMLAGAGQRFITVDDVQGLRAFAQQVGQLPRNDIELHEVVDQNSQLTKWLWSEPRLIKCADIAAIGQSWPALETELKQLVSKIEGVGGQLQSLGTELLASFDRALDDETSGQASLTSAEQQACAGAATRLKLFEGYAMRADLLASGVRGSAQAFTQAMRTQALPSLRKLWIAASADLDAEPGFRHDEFQAFYAFRALLEKLLLDDTAEVGASALFDACSLLHDYIHTAAERLAAIQAKAELLEFILCLEEVLNLWREVRRQAREVLEALE